MQELTGIGKVEVRLRKFRIKLNRALKLAHFAGELVVEHIAHRCIALLASHALQTLAQPAHLRAAHAAAAAVILSAEERSGLAGPQIGAALQERRLAAVTQVRERLGTVSRSDPDA